MGNINDYGLPQMKAKLGVTVTTNDAEYLRCLDQAIKDISARDGVARTITIGEGDSHALSPAPEATSELWNIFAAQAIYVYRNYKLQEFLADLGGAAALSDAVTSVSRTETIRVLKELVTEAKAEVTSVLMAYSLADAFEYAEIENRYTVATESDF